MPAPSEIQAPPHWEAVDFVSDLHLGPDTPGTLSSWQRYLDQTPAHALFLLGDFFEVWVGDDLLDHPEDPAGAFGRDCLDALASASRRLDIFFMPGNRDFLVGPRACLAAGMVLLPDPVRLDCFGRHWLLAHGDAWCLADTDYQKFRSQVRSPQWQQAFLSRPLQERQQIAAGIRQASTARKQQHMVWADVDADAALLHLRQANASTLIHGHTHQPADHWLDKCHRRVVLSDWDTEPATPQPRAEVLRLTAGGLSRMAVR